VKRPFPRSFGAVSRAPGLGVSAPCQLDTADLRDLFVFHPFEADQQQRYSLLLGKPSNGPFQIAEL
jgi:hypothetical protein